MATARVGISGWVYPAWRKTFYPDGLAHRRELSYASERLSTIEINGSFYALQKPSSYQRWYDETPADFVFSVKGPRFITHMKKLGEPRTPLANFFASGLLALADKLGPVLWQLPPNLGLMEQRLIEFCELLPRTTDDAAQLAREHDERITEDRELTTTTVRQPIRHAIEVRHEGMAGERAIQILHEHDIAVVLADSAGKFPVVDAVTADFAYIRLHGADELYVSGYSDATLDSWAGKIHDFLADGLDTFVYFDNDAKVHAPYNAMSLAERLD